MKKLFAAALLAMSGVAPAAWAADEGDTQTVSHTTCAAGAGSCTTTITEMMYVNGRWVIVSISTHTFDLNKYRKEQ